MLVIRDYADFMVKTDSILQTMAHCALTHDDEGFDRFLTSLEAHYAEFPEYYAEMMHRRTL